MAGYHNASERSQLQALDVAVLMGGDSSEREISLQSGIRVAAALEKVGHHVAAFDPAEVELSGINWDAFDACFIALHGGAGEDGRVQLELEELGVPYTGSGPAASRLAMSKSASKQRFVQFGVPTPRAIAFYAHREPDGISQRLQPLGWPLVIKPDSQGCSLGVDIARTRDDLHACIRSARRYEAFLLAERLVSGREITVAVVDRMPLPALEIVHSGDVFDFETKFGGREARHVFPNDAAAGDAEQAAVVAAEALGTRGLVRVDILLDEHGQPWVLEVNTIPGMTEHSLAPMAAQRAGIVMADLCDRLVRACIVEEAMA